MKNTTLRHYQQEAVDKALSFYSAGGRGFLCGDKCGLGKTVVALKVAEEMPKKHNMVCIIAPAFVVPKWKREIMARCDDDRDYKFAVYSYSEISDINILRQAVSVRYDLIIFDEVHYAKSYKAARTIATLGDRGVQLAADKLLGLSATVPPNNISDCYQWLKASKSPIAHGGFETFCHEFGASCYRDQFGLHVTGFKPNEKWMQYFPPSYIGRCVDDVTSEIPDGLRVDSVVDMSKAIEKAEMKLFGQIIDDPELMQKAIEAQPSFDALTEFRKMQGMAKTAEVINYTLEAWESGEKKILIFAYHQEVAEKITTALIKKKLPVILITGQNTAAEDRDNILQEENKKDESIIVATIDSLREGVDATGFTLTLFAEIDWRAWALEQCEGRTRRIGQTQNVRWVYFFFARGVDKMMRGKIKEKSELASAVRATQQ